MTVLTVLSFVHVFLWEGDRDFVVGYCRLQCNDKDIELTACFMFVLIHYKSLI